jgi:ABC-type transport system substrate-binding protein
VVAPRDGYWGNKPTLDQIIFVDNGDDPAAQLAALTSG